MTDVEVQRIEVFVPEGGYTMNAYIVRDPQTGSTAIVDPGADAQKLIDAGGPRVEGIWITHGHHDHVGALEEVRATTRAPVTAHRLEVDQIPGGADILVDHGQTLLLGQLPVRVLHVPGHTPGHIAFLAGRHLLGGDLLFPGGPGQTISPEALRLLLAGIQEHLLALDDGVMVHPGHGEPTTIGAAREEHAAFLRRTDTERLYGDVTWR